MKTETGVGKVTWLKEIVTGLMGGAIILGMFMMLWPLVNRDPPDVQSAQSIVSILGGWVGLIIGYYFGRLPAEKVAARAEIAASVAEEAKTKAVIGTKTKLAERKQSLSQNIEKFESLVKVISELSEEIEATTEG